MSMHLITAFILGVSSHIFYFRRGEHHMSGPWLAACVPFSWTLIAVLRLRNESPISAVRGSTLLLGIYAASLYGSIIIYRVVFHPLRHFPGPILARVSKFWHVFKLSDLQNQLLLEDLHQQYGDIVRIGPNELAIFRNDGIPAVHRPNSKCIKAPWYDMLQKDRSIHATRQPGLHQPRRRIWDQGFGTKALKSYQERVSAKVELLVHNIARSTGQPIDSHQLFLFFGFDVMGDIAFGEGFGMLEQNKPHPIMNTLRSGIYLLGRLSPVPWLMTILMTIPRSKEDWVKMEQFSEERVMLKLIDAARDPEDKAKIDMHWLSGDAMVIIIAGSDTVSATLTLLFYHLALLPEHVQKLRKELMNVDMTDNRKLQPLPHRNALINETLRLFLGGRRIPGGATISTPLWSQEHLESSFTRASEFIPERWYPGSGMIKDQQGFAPFLLGTHSCLGKQVALIELRLVVARLVTSYDFQFANNYDGSKGMKVQDCFTALPGSLKLIFTPRN
ncbi:putative benzoate 4-monooxygenase cytochrome P450 [Lentithecium fluviatile CBS 122367]|uniref:Putative benzoate 4-monooxygenase cytochrome P450 n=1 Tax=Lentithecium fluviatile CBS 122367 TaxID=1168545 RepID=A0A6G1ISA1_9PLEO|nr:putative benzoate 4-monooxygenase cytochrome P450 [Lentithecium fluviatile CBS 122367]